MEFIIPDTEQLYCITDNNVLVIGLSEVQFKEKSGE